MGTVETLREYFKRELPAAGAVEPDQSLLATNLLDSLAIVKLLTFIEATFDVQISDDEFDPDHFESLRTISALIEAKRSG